MKLYHVSEEPGIKVFRPRPSPQAYNNITGSVVFAVNDEMLHNYLLPRDCPRVTYYSTEKSTKEDIDKFIGSSCKYIITVEEGWLERIKQAVLYVYELPAESFSVLDEGAGYYISYNEVIPLSVKIINNILPELAERNAELRSAAGLRILADGVSRSSLQFSIIRMRNADPAR